MDSYEALSRFLTISGRFFYLVAVTLSQLLGIILKMSYQSVSFTLHYAWASYNEADSLKPDQPGVDNIQTENIQSRTNLGGVRKTPSPDNENEQKALVSQLETVVKKLSQVELHNQTLQMEVKQARNASELLKHEKEDLQEKLQNSTSSLEKRSKECETLQSRFEKLVGDLQESETEVSKARSSLKTERDKALTMIERLSQQIEVLEMEKKESKERMKKWEADSGSQQKHMRQLEKNQEESQEIIKKLIAKMEGYKQRLEAKGDEGSSSQTQRLQELQEVNKQLQVRLEETEQQLEAKKETTQSAPNVEAESELESELADLRMELSEKDEQIEQLSEQLEEEYSERSELQKKYDNLCTESAQFILEGQGDKAATSPVGELEEKLHKAVAQVETLNTQLNNESSQRKQAEDKLSGELSEKQKLERTIHELEEQLRSIAEKSEEPHAQEDVKNLMELLQGKNKEVEKMQSEVKRVDMDRLSLLEQSSKLQVDIDTMKKQLKQSEDSKSTLEGDLECVLQSKLDLEESAKQTATELETVKSELEILRQASQNAASAATEASILEAVQKENLLVKAQVEKVQKMYTDDMFKKEQLLAEEQEKRMELERKLITQQSRATQREEEIAKQEREGGEKLLAMTQQVEQLGQKAERGEKELKRLRAELKTSQDNYDALELKHMQSIEESKQQQKSQQEQLELMGRRIQDLTSKLGSAERKVRDLASAEAGWSSFGGGGNSSVHRVHLGAESGTTCISPSSGIHSQLKEVEEVLGSAECRIQRQQQKASALEGKIESVEKHMEAIEQASPSSNLSSVDHDVSVNSSSSPSSHSSINQLAGVTTPAPKQADISDTSDSSDCPSSDGADGSSKIKILESRLAEMEQKLKQVTHRLVDVTTRELEKRKAYQAKCIAENKLKDQVRGLQREVLALRQQMEKVQSHSESSARQTHSVLNQCRQHLVRILPAKFQQTIGLGGTDSPGVHKGPTNTAANPTDKSTTAAPSSVAAVHILDACHTLDKALDILISQLKSLDKRKRKSLTEFSESIIHGLSGDIAHFSDGECPKSPISCPTSPLFFPTSPTISPDISPRSGKVSDLRFGSFMKFPTKSYESSFVGDEKLQRIRYGHCLLEVEYLNSFLEDMSGQGCAEEDVAKLLSCHRLLEAEERQSEDVRSVGDGGDVSGFAGGLSGSITKEAESEFLSMKEPAEHGNVIGSHEISAVYSACTTFFTNNWEYSHALEKQLEEACDDLAKDLAEETAAKKEESQSESKKSAAKTKQPSRTQSQRSGGKNDSGLGLEADLAPFAEGIAYEEALRVAMECVSSELVLAEALQCVNETIEDFVKKIDVEEQKCKRILVYLKDVGTHRFNLIRDAIARQLEATSGLIRQKYWDYLQESEDEGDDKIEECKKRKKTAHTKENQKNGTTKGLEEDHEGVLEKEVAILVLMKAVLSGLVVHFRSELSLLAEGNSNQNNNSISGLLPRDFFDLEDPIGVSDPSESTTNVCQESREGGEGVGGNWAGAVRQRASTLERISAEHSRNIAMVRERYEAILKGERKVHEQELIQLRQRLLTANAAVKGLEEDIERMGRSDETLGHKGLETHLRRGHREIREAQQELNSMKSDILELVRYHEMKLGHIAEGIHTITTCYQLELEQLHAHYERLLGEAEDRGQRELVKAHQKYKTSIAEMERHHEAQTKRLVKEAKQQQGDEMLQAQQRSHRKALDDMQRSHQHELEKREEVHKKEKEDEDKAVTTAISAVKRAYEAELEKERRLSGESSPKEVESIMKRHREVVDQMNKDWLILSHKFSEQCKENSTLNKALRAMQRSQREAYERLQRAQVENRQRVDSLGQELARLEGMVQGGDTAAGGGGSGGEGDESDEEEESSEEVKLMQVNLKLRELELEFAQEEIENLRRAKEEASAGLKSGAEQPGAGDIAHRGSLASIQTESDGSTRPKSRRSLSDLTTRFYKSKKSDKK